MNKHIFLVDDEVILSMSLRKLLEANDYRTTLLTSGEDCLSELSMGTRPDLILMDINFGPGKLDGQETTQKINEQYDVPVVLHSAYTDQDTLGKMKEMTQYGYIQKNPGNESFVVANIEMALKLHSSNKLYQELFHNSNDAIFLTYLDESGMPGNFFEVNDTACDYLGYSREELLSMRPEDINAGELDSETSSIMRELHEKKRITFEWAHTTKTGTVIPVEISSHQFVLNKRPITISSVRNISKRISIEKEMRESEELHRTTLSSISDTVFLTDESGEFIYICPNVDVIFGYSEEDVLKLQNIDKIFGDLLISTDELDKVGERHNTEAEIQDKRGKSHILLVNIKRVSIKGATRLYTCREITELKQKERDLLNSEKMYRELSNHLQNVREEQNAYIAREIHDDLGQSITALKMNLTMIDNTLKKESPLENTGMISETTQDMKHILNGIVKKIRALTTELRPVVLDTFGIVEAIKWHTSDFEKQFSIPTLFHSDIEEIEIGKEKSLAVFRIVQEALTNSVRHGNPTEISVTMTASNGRLVVVIDDNGTGFSSSKLERKQSYGILGMKERAKQNGGSLQITSDKSAGTTIQLKIPF